MNFFTFCMHSRADYKTSVKIALIMKVSVLLIFVATLRVSASGNANNRTTTKAAPINLFTVREMRGIITDSLGVLPGVSVSIKGNPKLGTTTDLNGKYRIDIPNEDVILVFSMIGYVTQEIPVSGKLTINVRLKGAVSVLNDVVVVAFGTQKKTELVGSITTIKPSELKVPSSNLTTALAGQAAGIIAYQRSGEPGQDNADFFIRGVTTFGYKKDPLILIDGVELSTTELARLQPDDIASFSIMKDAASTALYGARGANGVISVSTKQGKEGKATMSFRLENSISGATKNVEFADPITYMNLENEAILTRTPLADLAYSQQKIDNTARGVNAYAFPSTDWRALLFKNNTTNQRANMNISGGGPAAQYYVAGSFDQDNGVLNVDKRNNFNSNIDLKSYNLRSNVNINLTKSTEMVVRLNGNFDDYGGPISGGTQLYHNVMRTSPVDFPAYYPANDATFGYVNHILFGNSSKEIYMNPYADMVKGYKSYSQSLMLAQLELKQGLDALTKGLSVRALFNTNRRSYFDVTRAYNPFYYSADSYDRVANTYVLTPLTDDTGTEYLNYVPGSENVESTFYLEAAVNYARTFKKHGISAMLVNTMRSDISTLSSTATGSASLQASLPSRNTGLSGRATYNYDGRFYGEFNFGYNGSERFYTNHRFGFFPSAGVAWNIAQEKFMKPLDKIITSMRLRATYGLVGNDAIGSPTDRFFYLSNVNLSSTARAATFGNLGGYTRNGVAVSRYSNTDITWEESKKANYALELGLFNSLNFTAEYFTEKRDHILMARTNIPTTTGLSAIPEANVGKADANGIDLSLDYSHFFNNSFWFQARANLTYAVSKLVVDEEPNYVNAPYLSKVGYSLGQTWGYIAEHLFVDDKEVANSPTQSFGGLPTAAGDIKYRDVNNDGQITPLDMVPIGNPVTPEIVYGFGFSTGYKNFDISAFFQGVANESFWIDVNATAPFTSYSYSGESTSGKLQNELLKAYADNHWSEDNRDIYALWPRLSNVPDANNQQVSTWFMRDGSFLRLKSLEIGYTLPKAWTDRIKSKKVRIYTNGTNLLTFSSFKLWDVEMAGNGLGYPVQKVFNFGVNVSF